MKILGAVNLPDISCIAWTCRKTCLHNRI